MAGRALPELLVADLRKFFRRPVAERVARRAQLRPRLVGRGSASEVQTSDRGDPVEDQDSVQVIDLVLDGARLEAHRPELPVTSLEVTVEDSDPARPPHLGNDGRQAEAPLPGGLAPEAHLDHG